MNGRVSGKFQLSKLSGMDRCHFDEGFKNRTSINMKEKQDFLRIRPFALPGGLLAAGRGDFVEKSRNSPFTVQGLICYDGISFKPPRPGSGPEHTAHPNTRRISL